MNHSKSNFDAEKQNHIQHTGTQQSGSHLLWNGQENNVLSYPMSIEIKELKLLAATVSAKIIYLIGSGDVKSMGEHFITESTVHK